MSGLEDVRTGREKPTRINQAYFEIFEEQQAKLFGGTDEIGDPAIESFTPEQLGQVIRDTIAGLSNRALIEDSAYIEQLGYTGLVAQGKVGE